MGGIPVSELVDPSIDMGEYGNISGLPPVEIEDITKEE